MIESLSSIKDLWVLEFAEGMALWRGVAGMASSVEKVWHRGWMAGLPWWRGGAQTYGIPPT